MPRVLATLTGVPLLLGGHLVTPLGPPITAPLGPPTALTLMDFVTSWKPIQPVVQRKAGQTYADVPVLFAFSGGPPASVQARVVKASGGAVVKDWTTLTGLSTATATGSGRLPGVPQGKGYLLQIRDGDSQPASGPLYSAGSVPWGVGVVFLFQGQSNMLNTLGGSYQAVVPGTSTSELDDYAANLPGAFFDGNGWHGQGHNDGTQGPGSNGGAMTNAGNPQMFLRIVAAALKVKYGYDVPVAMIPWAFNAHPIEAFMGPNAGYGGPGRRWSDMLGAAGTTLGSYGMAGPRNVFAGDFEGVLYHQGEANAGDSTAAYQAKLAALRQTYLDYVAPAGRTAATFLFGVAVLGSYAPGACPAIENIRAAQRGFALAAGGGTQTGWTTVDLRPGNDGLHFGNPAEQRRSMRRAIQTVLCWLGCASFSGQGPFLSGAVARSGLVATLDVTFTGGTALAPPAPGAVTGWAANTAADFSGSDIPVTVATTAAGSKVAVTFPAGTTFPAYLKHLGGQVGSTAVDANGFNASCYPDTTNMLYDNCSYPSTATGGDVDALGLPLLPSVGSIAIS